MKKYLLLVALAISSVCFSCTDNQMARNYGGTEEITLPKNHQLLNVTWKEDDMWVISKDTITNICYAHEKSSFGILEGTIVISPEPITVLAETRIADTNVNPVNTN